MSNAKKLISDADDIVKEFNELKKDIKETKDRELGKKDHNHKHEDLYNNLRQEMEDKIKEIL